MLRSTLSTTTLCLALVASTSVRLAAAASPTDVDAYVRSEIEAHHTPGLALLVVQGGQVVKSQGYGLANVEHQVPVTPDTIFQSGSVGKQFTATAVMMLVEEGRVALDDKISKYFDGTPEAWQGITVRHLLSHTAGVANYPQSFDFRRNYTEDRLLKITQDMPLLFQPGEKWAYSNPGYITLGILIRQVTGDFYGDFLRQRIFQPLGMTATRLISEADIVPHRAAGYRLVKGELKNQDWVSPSMNTTADGSLYFNLVDVAKWDAALDSERLLKRATLEQMWTPVTLADGQPNQNGYGFGWFRRQRNGHTLVEHGGAWQGFTTYIGRYLDDRLTVVVLTNMAAGQGVKLEPLASRVAGMYVADLMPETPAPSEAKPAGQPGANPDAKPAAPQ